MNTKGASSLLSSEKTPFESVTAKLSPSLTTTPATGRPPAATRPLTAPLRGGAAKAAERVDSMNMLIISSLFMIVQVRFYQCSAARASRSRSRMSANSRRLTAQIRMASTEAPTKSQNVAFQPRSLLATWPINIFDSMASPRR